jgi:nicotinic acid mononucleotide adenylyltransferase
MPRYRVLVDDNFHYQDSEERWEEGTYATVEEAIAACRSIVDRSLEEERRPGISAEALYDRYMSFGDDPSIVVLDGTDASATFSAWRYAKERCRVICGVH